MKATTVRCSRAVSGALYVAVSLGVLLVACPQIARVVETPVFEPPGGTYNAPQTVTITTDTAAATVLYTTDGSDPVTSATVDAGDAGTSQASVAVDHTTTIKAYATKEGLTDSPVVEAAYRFTLSNVGGTWRVTQTPDSKAEAATRCLRLTQNGTDVRAQDWSHDCAIPLEGTLANGTLDLSGEGLYYGTGVLLIITATSDGRTLDGTYAYTGGIRETGTWTATSGKCRQSKAWVRHIDSWNDGHSLDFYVWDLIADGTRRTNAGVSGPNTPGVVLTCGGFTEFDPCTGNLVLGATEPHLSDTYSFLVKYSDNISEVAKASVREMLVDFPVLVSPAAGEIVATQRPTFSWQAPSCGCQGGYELTVLDSRSVVMWSAEFAAEVTTAVYNADATGTALQPGATYQWQLTALDPPTSGGVDNGTRLAATFVVAGT